MITSEHHQERHRLLLAMKKAPDYYELAFSSSEHAGYLNGLHKAGVISEHTLAIYQREASTVSESVGCRLANELDRAAAQN